MRRAVDRRHDPTQSLVRHSRLEGSPMNRLLPKTCLVFDRCEWARPHATSVCKRAGGYRPRSVAPRAIPAGSCDAAQAQREAEGEPEPEPRTSASKQSTLAQESLRFRRILFEPGARG